MPHRLLRLGTAGWSIPKQYAGAFPAGGSHLARYAQTFNAVEINSSFYRPHRRTTYERWAASVPDTFRFAVKLPKDITHTSRLAAPEAALDAFAGEVGGLGRKLGPLLVQLPPNLVFDADIVGAFFTALRAHFPGDAVCEPRHASWLSDEADALLDAFKVSRVAAHPAIGMKKITDDAAAEPASEKAGGRPGLFYLRLHGAPRVYYSNYDDAALVHYAGSLRRASAAGSAGWCMFDNTAAGFATANAFALQRLLLSPPNGSP